MCLSLIFIVIMIGRVNDWSPQFFHQKGWIANKFQVKNPNSAALRWKRRTHTETHLNPHRIQRPQYHSTEMNKPSTAPDVIHSRGQIVQNLQKMGAASASWQQPPPINESRYSNFRTTVHNRKQLLYIKPYTRYQNSNLTIDQKKMQIYKQINNPDLTFYLDSQPQQSTMIEYLTEYKDPYSSRPSDKLPKHKRNNPNKNRLSLSILREKLKRKCEPSIYKNKINAAKFQ